MDHNFLNNSQFDTVSIHAGYDNSKDRGALSTPIYQTSTFASPSVEEAVARINDESDGFVYSRRGNPTVAVLEQKLAAIEGGEACVCTASGLGAIGSVCIGLLKSGDHVICNKTLYGGTDYIMRTNLAHFGIETDFVDMSDIDAFEKAFRDTTKMVYFETPANPTLQLVDIKMIAQIAHSHGAKVVIDNTFAPPPIQFPLKLGADIVVHSITKYLNGHGDVIGGAVIGSKEDVHRINRHAVVRICGTIMSPANAFYVIRGLKTLDMRVRKHCENALKVAQFLENHPAVQKVYYPGLPSFEQYDLAQKQMNGIYGGVVSFELNDDVNGLDALSAGIELLNNFKMIAIAVSLGDVDTLAEHPASMTHGRIPKESRIESGITDGLIRLSIGLENSDDIIRDISESLDKIGK